MVLPLRLRLAARRAGVRWTRHLLLVWVGSQRLDWFESVGEWRWRRRFVVSTSRHGTGQLQDSHRTPLGLHRIARKVGGGWPVGTVFRARQPIGLVWNGLPRAPIAHRIFWLEGLEPGFNRGGAVDSFRRFIYLHGVGEEPSLGRPASIGCIHLAASDLMPLFETLPVGTLVWVSAGPAPRFRGGG